MKVDKKEIYLDEEDEYIALSITLGVLKKEYEEMPRWLFVKKEWNEYLMRKLRMEKRLRVLQGKMGYDSVLSD